MARAELPCIQFLSFAGCPLADAARTALHGAMHSCGLAADACQYIDIMDPATPAELARWGSPTILVNGRDVTGQEPGEGVGCRVYNTADHVPNVETIAAAIMRHLL